MLFSLWNNIRGYVIIRLEGVGLERLLNRCESQGIPLWNIRRTGRMSMLASAPYMSLRKIRALARKNNCQVEVDARRGIMPNIIGMLGKKAFLLCALAAIVATVAFTQFVWIIEINGDAEAQSDIVARLEKLDVRQGTGWSQVDTLTLPSQLMMQNDYAARVVVNRQGVKLIVDVIPIDPPPEYIENTTPCDIVASMDGVIIKATALDGTPLVSSGQTVKKGDVLIKGEFTNEEQVPTSTVAARGEVYAKVWHSGAANVPASEVNREPTGRAHTIRKIYMAGWEIDVDKLPEDFGDYVIDTEQRTDISRLYIPAQMVSTNVKEVKTTVVSLQYTQAENAGRQLAYDDAMAQLPAGTAIYDVQYSSKMLPDGQMEVRAFVQTVEQIGVVQYH